jgi:hypothetical protein
MEYNNFEIMFIDFLYSCNNIKKEVYFWIKNNSQCLKYWDDLYHYFIPYLSKELYDYLKMNNINVDKYINQYYIGKYEYIMENMKSCFN